MAAPTPSQFESATRPSEADRFSVLGSARRRHLLAALAAREGTGPLPAVATDVAAAELGVPAETVPPHDRKRVYISCYQTHVPRLATVGYVDYDPETGVLALTEDAATLEAPLGWAAPRPRVPLALLTAALLGGGLFGGVLLGVPGLGLVPTPVAAFLVVAALVLVAAVAARRERGRRFDAVGSRPR